MSILPMQRQGMPLEMLVNAVLLSMRRLEGIQC